jgi:environmental stress-induced protein Ves
MRAWTLTDCPVMPWKNGGGSTTELAIFPAGATLADFDWRISSASVAADGPFSVFEGLDRSLALLQGGPMDLMLDGAKRHSLPPDGTVFCFAGERAVSATLPAGPVVDLNVMTRRAGWSHKLLRLAEADAYLFARDGTYLWLYCSCGSGKLKFSGQEKNLQPGQMLMFDAADVHAEYHLQLPTGSVCYLAHLFSKD